MKFHLDKSLCDLGIKGIVIGIAKNVNPQADLSSSFLKKKKEMEDWALACDLDEVLEKCDVLTLHVPLTDSTRNLIDLEKMKKMKRSARILNLARGPVINQDDLYFALKNKIIKSAAIDVTSVEPIEKNSKLFELDNIVITPHIAWKSEKSMITLMNDVEKNLKLFIEGKLEGLK